MIFMVVYIIICGFLHLSQNSRTPYPSVLHLGLLLLNGKDRAGIGQKSDRNVMKPMPLNKVPWPARCNKKIQ